MAASVRRFSMNLVSSSSRQPEPEQDHFIVLKDNTLPAPNAAPPVRDSSHHHQPTFREGYGVSLSRATTSNLSSVSENVSPAASASISRVQSIASMSDRPDPQTTNGRASGHFSAVPSASSAGPSNSAPPGHGHRRKDSLRKHLAERKYHRNWKQQINNINSGELSGKSSSNSSESGSSDTDYDSDRSSRPNGKRHNRMDRGKEKVKDLPVTVLSKKAEIQSKGAKALRKARQVGRRVRKEELVDDAGELDILYENQRGTFLFGIPMFSAKSLLPVDSAPWTNRHHAPSAVNIFNAQVPDPSWTWSWKSFAVDMTGDVDEEGWQYSFAFRGSKWHGNAVWWHGFVRRRRWIRKRVKRRLANNVDEAHNLTPEYFTIHSRHASVLTERSGYYSGSIPSVERNSKLEEYPTATQQDSEDSELEDIEISDIPTLMRAFKRARLDREKVEAMNSFLQNGGAEVVYLADNISRIMRSMIFQQSRRQLLQILLDTLTKANEKRQARIKAAENTTSQPNGKAAAAVEDYDDDEEKRYIDGLGRAVDAGEEEVRKLEYWSDVKRVQADGYEGVENTHDHSAHRKFGGDPGADADDSDLEYANIWRARGKLARKRKEQMAGKARGEFAERDETDKSTLASRETDGSARRNGAPLTARDKGKGRATE